MAGELLLRRVSAGKQRLQQRAERVLGVRADRRAHAAGAAVFARALVQSLERLLKEQTVGFVDVIAQPQPALDAIIEIQRGALGKRIAHMRLSGAMARIRWHSPTIASCS